MKPWSITEYYCSRCDERVDMKKDLCGFCGDIIDRYTKEEMKEYMDIHTSAMLLASGNKLYFELLTLVDRVEKEKLNNKGRYRRNGP